MKDFDKLGCSILLNFVTYLHRNGRGQFCFFVAAKRILQIGYKKRLVELKLLANDTLALDNYTIKNLYTYILGTSQRKLCLQGCAIELYFSYCVIEMQHSESE